MKKLVVAAVLLASASTFAAESKNARSNAEFQAQMANLPGLALLDENLRPFVESCLYARMQEGYRVNAGTLGFCLNSLAR